MGLIFVSIRLGVLSTLGNAGHCVRLRRKDLVRGRAGAEKPGPAAARSVGLTPGSEELAVVWGYRPFINLHGSGCGSQCICLNFLHRGVSDLGG